MADIKTYYTSKRDQNKSVGNNARSAFHVALSPLCLRQVLPSLRVFETPVLSQVMAFRQGKRMLKIQNLRLTKDGKSYLIT
jgi:hypothetical protein